MAGPGMRPWCLQRHIRIFVYSHVLDNPSVPRYARRVTTLQEFKAELFRAMASPVRIRILETLRAANSLTVGELQQRLSLEQSNVSQHLSILRAHGLVTTRREATSVHYSISAPQVSELLDVARSLFEQRLESQSRVLNPAPIDEQESFASPG